MKAKQEPAIKCVIIDMTAVTAIDTSGIDTICELRRILGEKRSLKLVLANPVGNVMEKLFKSNALEAFGLDGLYLTVSVKLWTIFHLLGSLKSPLAEP
ncbi:putative sulfate transporter 3.4 [Datura stramonium]|uniref:Sulfate transporter 3.4 n=1 Tax=Datura stramonium TaxID=4076 RepID=A0ABS8S4Y9_DATST|nr:putative sulfate transporter 3.4 [Datura stramonium]